MDAPLTELKALQQANGAVLAPDGIPLHFGDQRREYLAARDGAIVLDRSHEGRLRVSGKDRMAFIHRISTNALESLTMGEGRPTLLTNANARILERIVVYHHGDVAWVTTEPGRASAVVALLKGKIFFNDDALVQDETLTTARFALYGVGADQMIRTLGVDPDAFSMWHMTETTFGGKPVLVERIYPLIGAGWAINVLSLTDAGDVWQALVGVGAIPAGSLTYNALRIESGRPAVGRELTADYIPLEVGLWDEVSFSKGCYTGQEILARMESRNQLAKVAVRVQMAQPVQAPQPLMQEGREVGRLTSSVETPLGEYFGIAIVKTAAFSDDSRYETEAGIVVTVLGLAATAPPARMLGAKGEFS